MVRHISIVSHQLMVVLDDAPGGDTDADYSTTALTSLQQQRVPHLPRHTCQQIFSTSVIMHISIVSHSSWSLSTVPLGATLDADHSNSALASLDAGGPPAASHLSYIKYILYKILTYMVRKSR